MSHDELELRVAWERYVASIGATDAVFESLLQRHRAADRHYHGVRHVTWVVRHVLDIGNRHPVDDLGAIVAAAFFHDAVHDPTATDNEVASARLATTTLSHLGWDDPRCERVAAMVLATATHAVDEVDLDTQVLLAADLAVLAAEPNRYGDYVRAVRREYAHVTDSDWGAGRSEVLQRLIARADLFAPALALGEWEQRARANIAAELADLRRGSTS